MLSSASIGLAIAYPIMQSGMFIAALWGMLLFHELYSLKPHLVYWAGGLVLLCGILLLVNAGGRF
jgi:glucose uptake protein GlcU